MKSTATTACQRSMEIAAAEKTERKRTLVNALCGRFPQRRDEQGRYTADFSGGARQSAPMRQPPKVEHNETLLSAMRSGESDVGVSIKVRETA
jgi:hypothetical protein